MASRELTVHLVPGTPRLGLWCDDCMTSGRYEVDVYGLMLSSPPSLLSVIRGCSTCDHRDA